MKNRTLPLVIVFSFFVFTFFSFQNFTLTDQAGSIIPVTADFKLVTLESNNYLPGDGTSANPAWPPSSASDGAITTVYSTNIFFNDPAMTNANANNPKPYLIGRLSKKMPISRVTFGARVDLPSTFPVVYDVFILNGEPTGTNWVQVGTYGNRPDSLNVVSIDFGKIYFAGGVKIVPRYLGTMGGGNHIFQLGEMRVLGPSIHRFSSGPKTNSLAIDFKDDTYDEYYAGESSSNTNNLSASFTLTEAAASKVFIRAHKNGTNVFGYPSKYRVGIIAYNNSFIDLGEYTDQPDVEGNVYIDLKGNRLVRSVRITPVNFGPGQTTAFAFRIAEINLIGPFNYLMAASESNENHGSSALAIDSNFSAGNQRITWYSSNAFATALNDRNVYIAAWTQGLEPVSSITFYSRFSGGQSWGFPATYIVKISNPTATAFEDVGTFSAQPSNIDGTVTINLGKTYLTHGIYVLPQFLNRTNTGEYRIHFADLRSIANATDGDFVKGTTSIFSYFSNKGNEFLLNGFARVSLQIDGNLLVTNDLNNNSILWQANVHSQDCTNNQCKFEFSNGYFKLSRNGTIYWTTQNFNSAAASEMRFSRFPPYFQTVNSAGTVLWTTN